MRIMATSLSRGVMTSSLLGLLILVTAVLGAQRFIERPQNISVIQGESVVLKCVVADRVGNVQWVKDGFALGFDRNIPGYPTYSVVGTESRKFNLMIANTQLSDDANYQCQVTPGGPGHPRLTASAYLTVLVPCDPPVIQGYQNGSTVEVPFTRRSLELVCEARHGRPPAEIEWFRNGVKVVDNVVYETVPVPGNKRTDARSRLTLRIQGNGENDASYMCQAKNSAVMGAPLSTTVTISILYPPGSPVITGYTTGQVVRTNSTVILTCTSTGGNPLGTVVWRKGDRRIDSSFTSGRNRAINEYTFVARASDNGVQFTCEVTNLVTTAPLTASFTLTVHFPPQSVRMSGGRGSLSAGDRVRLRCETTHSNPQAPVTWFARGRQIPSRDVTNRFRSSPDGGWVTRSEVNVRLTQQDHNVVYTCQATNDLGSTVQDTVTLSVSYPPDPPTISGYTEGATLRADHLERLTCMSAGGNPEAVLKWYKNGRQLRNAQYTVIGNIAQSQIGVVARPDDNGAVYKCTATNDATTRPLEASVTMTVLFPPSSVNITTSTSQPRAGEGMTLTCVSSSSNPAAEITWLKGGVRVQGVNRGVVDAAHGGKNTTSVLHLIPTSSDHNAVYGCRATNTLLGLAVTDAVTLTALFPPEFHVSTPQALEMTEGESRTLNLTAYANPTGVTYTLSRVGRPTRFRVRNGMLSIRNINKRDGGNFTVRAVNSQGSATYNFSIRVKYKASITRVTDSVLADEGGTAVFSCEAEANPIIPNMITWTRPGFDMAGKTQQKVEGTRSELRVHELVRADTGSFRCVADNGIGRPDTRSAQLIVKYAPMIDKSPENAKAASDPGRTATLTCKAEGAPAVSFRWTKDNRTLTRSRKYSITSNRRRAVHFVGTLRIRDVNRHDYGSYNCSASNSKGADSFLISLHGTSKPDPPYDLQFVNATHDSITIQWNPGFNGGLNQSFRVRYKPRLARGYIYVDVTTPVTPLFTMTGLQLGTEYQITVLAFNSLGESDFQSQGLVARTASTITPTDISTSELQGSDDVPVLIILVVCIVGVFLLTLNIGLILFFVRRRKKRLENSTDRSHTNTFELYGPTKPEAVQLFPVAMSEDTRSYGTYDKSMEEDLSDDYDNDYEEYSARAFTPNKLDSPRMTNPKTYLMDDHGTHCTWPQNPYHGAMPMNIQGMYDEDDDMYNNRVYPQDDTRPKSIMELAELSPHRASRGELGPPVPARHYGAHEVQPRYAPPPGSLSPNTTASPHYTGPPEPSPAHFTPGSQMTGHLM
ncbi:nephrin-like [Babylonia areolata]|uniref:nephrin-like n=1 Tax=Babylonia areolata TaxID=304850 RepID=UPI003FD3A459